MRILQINNYHYIKGGSDRVYFETSKLLEEKGHTVIHFSVNDKEALESPYKKYFLNGIDFLKKDKKSVKNILRFMYSHEAREKLENLIRNENPEIAHLHIFYGRIGLSILPVLKKYNIPAVMTVHEYKLLCPMYNFLNHNEEICEKCAKGNSFYCVINRCNRNSFLYSFISALECYVRDSLFNYEKYIDKFIMVSKFIQEKHLKYKPHLREKIAQIYNFVDIDYLSPNFSRGDYYLYFGRLSRGKGIMTLLKAWRHFPHLRLKIVGNGNLVDEMVVYITKNNMNNIEMTGYLTGNNLYDVIRRCKFTVVPSECYETFGLNVVEGFSCGKPTIASKIGAIPELIKDKVNGFLFEYGSEESLVNVVNYAENISDVNYREMCMNARALAENTFNKEIYYKKLINVYDEVIHNKKK